MWIDEKDNRWQGLRRISLIALVGGGLLAKLAKETSHWTRNES